jgi:carbon monoxide dehydrogenase subunit G
MKLDNVFTVGVPVSQAWAVLTDLELIAPCMPGAALTGVNDGVYTGKVKIKVGPVTAEYAGTAQFTEKDADSYRAVIDARGRDSRGNGNANAVISAQLLADGDRTTVAVTTDLTIAGRIAQFGSGMIKEVSAKLLGQFVTCLEAKLGGAAETAEQTAGATATRASADRAAAADAALGADAPGGTDAAAKADAAAEPAAAIDSAAGSVPAAGAAIAASTAATAEPEPIDLISVAGGALYSRLGPAVIGLTVIGLALLGVIVYLIVR